MSDETAIVVEVEPLLVDRKEAAAMLGICERKLWSMSAGGHIPSVKIGKSVRYAVVDLRKWVDKLRSDKNAGQDRLPR